MAFKIRRGSGRPVLAGACVWLAGALGGAEFWAGAGFGFANGFAPLMRAVVGAASRCAGVNWPKGFFKRIEMRSTRAPHPHTRTKLSKALLWSECRAAVNAELQSSEKIAGSN